MVDDVSSLRVYWRTVVPPSLPAIVAVATRALLGVQSEFLIVLILTRGTALAIALWLVTRRFARCVSVGSQDPAASIVFSLPPVLCFLLVQERFISGLTAGAIQG